MTEDEWNTIAMLLDKGFKWKEPFGAAHERTYQALLDGYSAQQIGNVLQALVARGQVFGPTPGEIVSLIRADPSKPTFVEAYALIYGRGGILRARAPRGDYSDMTAMDRARDEAARERAAGFHPLVGSFAFRYGLDRLRHLEVDHPDYGDLKRRELEQAWNQHCEANEGRELAAIAQGRRGEGLARLDPLAALGVSPRPELEAAS